MKKQTKEEKKMLGSDVEDRYIDRSELCEIGGFGRSTSYNLQDSDPTFPKTYQIGSKAVRFYLPEVRAWLAAQGGQQESLVDLSSKQSESTRVKPQKQKGAGHHRDEESGSESRDTQLVAPSGMSPAEPIILPTETLRASVDAHAEAKKNIVDVSSSKVFEGGEVMTEVVPIATADKRLLSESDADKHSASVTEVSSLLADNASGDDESGTASEVIASLSKVLKKILPIVNSFHFKDDQRSAYFKSLIEDVAKERKWVSFRELVLKFELKIEDSGDLWLRGLIKKLSEESFKEHGVHLSVLVGDDTVFYRNPDYYPCPEFLTLMGADNLDTNKVLALAWREMTKVHQAYQTERDI